MAVTGWTSTGSISWSGSESPGPITYSVAGVESFLTRDVTGDFTGDFDFITNINPSAVDRDVGGRIIWCWQSTSLYYALTYEIQTTPYAFYFQKNSTVINTNTIASYSAALGGNKSNITVKISKRGTTFTIGIDLTGGTSFNTIITATDSSLTHGKIGYATPNTWDNGAQSSFYFNSFTPVSSSSGEIPIALFNQNF